MRSCKRAFFSSPLTGARGDVLSTKCIRFASMGARVGHAWEKVHAMKGILPWSGAAAPTRVSMEQCSSGGADDVDSGGSCGRGMRWEKLDTLWRRWEGEGEKAVCRRTTGFGYFEDSGREG